MCARAGNRAVCLRCALHTGSESQRSGGPARFARPVSWVCCCPTAVASKPPKILFVLSLCIAIPSCGIQQISMQIFGHVVALVGRRRL